MSHFDVRASRIMKLGKSRLTLRLQPRSQVHQAIVPQKAQIPQEKVTGPRRTGTVAGLLRETGMVTDLLRETGTVTDLLRETGTVTGLPRETGTVTEENQREAPAKDHHHLACCPRLQRCHYPGMVVQRLFP